MGDLDMQISSIHLFVGPFVCVHSSILAFTLVFTLNEVYKLLNFAVTLTVTVLSLRVNKDDNSHSSGACFHILVCRCNKNAGAT